MNEPEAIAIVSTNAALSDATGRNGTYPIGRIAASFDEPTGLVFILGRSVKKKRWLNGGFVINPEAMDKLAIKWLKARGLTLDDDVVESVHNDT